MLKLIFFVFQNSTSWVLSNLAALYWRVVGQGQLAIKCLKHALYYSNEHNRVKVGVVKGGGGGGGGREKDRKRR